MALVLLTLGSLHSEPLTETEAVAKVKELPEFVAFSGKHKYAFYDNELLEN
mgnify:FL=1